MLDHILQSNQTCQTTISGPTAFVLSVHPGRFMSVLNKTRFGPSHLCSIHFHSQYFLMCFVLAPFFAGGDRRSRLHATVGPQFSAAEEDAPWRQQPPRVHTQLQVSGCLAREPALPGRPGHVVLRVRGRGGILAPSAHLRHVLISLRVRGEHRNRRVTRQGWVAASVPSLVVGEIASL